jgi:uncharacterized damage-inducible protein DinB
MNTLTIGRPAADEHDAYYARYISRVPDGDLVDLLRQQLTETVSVLRSIPESRGVFAYAPGKWSIKQVIGHMSDVERVMSYRALSFARNDKTELPGFDENQWAADFKADDRTVADLIDELEVVRSGTIQFAKHLTTEEQERRGKANGQPISVRALLYIIAGHERHHLGLLRERYSV